MRQRRLLLQRPPSAGAARRSPGGASSRPSGPARRAARASAQARRRSVLLLWQSLPRRPRLRRVRTPSRRSPSRLPRQRQRPRLRLCRSSSARARARRHHLWLRLRLPRQQRRLCSALAAVALRQHRQLRRQHRPPCRSCSVLPRLLPHQRLLRPLLRLSRPPRRRRSSSAQQRLPRPLLLLQLRLLRLVLAQLPRPLPSPRPHPRPPCRSSSAQARLLQPLPPPLPAASRSAPELQRRLHLLQEPLLRPFRLSPSAPARRCRPNRGLPQGHPSWALRSSLRCQLWLLRQLRSRFPHSARHRRRPRSAARPLRRRQLPQRPRRLCLALGRRHLLPRLRCRRWCRPLRVRSPSARPPALRRPRPQPSAAPALAEAASEVAALEAVLWHPQPGLLLRLRPPLASAALPRRLRRPSLAVSAVASAQEAAAVAASVLQASSAAAEPSEPQPQSHLLHLSASAEQPQRPPSAPRPASPPAHSVPLHRLPRPVQTLSLSH